MTTLASPLPRDPSLLVWMRRGLGLLVAAFLLLGAVSAYRAWVQVYRVSLQTVDAVLGPGAAVQVNAVTSGRTFVQLHLQLLQDGRAATLALDTVPKNVDATEDPRPQRRVVNVTLSPALWQQFHTGPALLRVTALGRPQWLRTPPPTIREISVTLR